MFCVDIDVERGGDEVPRRNDAEFDEGDQAGQKDAGPGAAPRQDHTDQPDNRHHGAHHRIDDVDVLTVELVAQVEGTQRDREHARDE